MRGEWPTVPLRELCDSQRGITYGIVQPGSHTEDGVAILRADDVSDGSISTASLLRVSCEIEAAYARSRLRGGEVLLTLVGAYFGKAAVARPIHAGLNIARAVGVIPVLRDPAFVAYALRSSACQRYIRNRATTTAQPTLNLRDVAEIPIPWPDPPVRHAITRVLGTLDDKIELNHRTNETLEAMARALFKSWFVDFDPVRAKAAGRQPSGMDAETAKLFPSDFEESELGEIPKGWKLATLGDLTSKIGSGATPRGGDRAYAELGIAFIRSQNVYDSEFAWEGLARITDADAEQLQGVTVRAEDVLMNITGASILRTCIVERAVLPARVSQHVAIIRAQEPIPAQYVHLHLLRDSTRAYLMGLDAGASRQAVTKGHIQSVPVLRPPDPVLERFRRLTHPLYEGVRNNREQERSLVALRDALLPRLLSGELSIGKAERFAGAAT